MKEQQPGEEPEKKPVDEKPAENDSTSHVTMEWIPSGWADKPPK